MSSSFGTVGAADGMTGGEVLVSWCQPRGSASAPIRTTAAVRYTETPAQDGPDWGSPHRGGRRCNGWCFKRNFEKCKQIFLTVDIDDITVKSVGAIVLRFPSGMTERNRQQAARKVGTITRDNDQ